VTPTRLMEELCCTKSNITQRLDVMEKNGLIQRTSLGHSKDKRKVDVSITALGREKLLEAIRMVSERGFEFEKKFAPKQIGECHAFLNKINDLLDHYDH
jgi:DNA-binding MarR family transcriptional regulator